MGELLLTLSGFCESCLAGSRLEQDGPKRPRSEEEQHSDEERRLEKMLERAEHGTLIVTYSTLALRATLLASEMAMDEVSLEVPGT